MWRPILAAALLFCLWLAPTNIAFAEHDLTCHPPDPPRGGGSSTGSEWRYVSVRRTALGNEDFGLNVVVSLSNEGKTHAQGIVQIRDGTSNTFFVGESSPATASCADIDEDGIGGMTALQFEVLNPRSGEILPVSITPLSGEVDSTGRDELIVVVGDTTFQFGVEVRRAPRNGLAFVALSAGTP